jgi:quinol monooxygenase YgiN
VVIVAGAFVTDPDRREEFLAGRLEGMRASRAEPGCLEYTLSADPIDPSRIVLFERWASQEALDTHLAAARTRRPSGSSGVTADVVSIMVYDVSGERPLGA